jgi:hypothetical protein
LHRWIRQGDELYLLTPGGENVKILTGLKDVKARRHLPDC